MRATCTSTSTSVAPFSRASVRIAPTLTSYGLSADVTCSISGLEKERGKQQEPSEGPVRLEVGRREHQRLAHRAQGRE